MDTYEAKVYFTIFLSVVVIAAILVLFIISLMYHHRRHLAAYELQVNAEIRTLENERKRIATDLHDDVGPLLSAVKMYLQCITVKEVNDVETLAKADQYLQDSIVKIKETSNNLVPRVLSHYGLVDAVKQFASDLTQSGKITVEVTVTGNDALDLDMEKQIHLYRIIQETINNALKYSRAQLFTIRMRVESNQFGLDLADNGKGFDYKKALNKEMGMGLRNILSRVDILKAEMFVDTKPGKGTKYSIIVPLMQ